ncbi:hypothetical protein [Paenibacillus curdlanolyticus]|uniref:hypothetical protein n=1 Tax=Paenibacillus curdlanolyticus TaxID=59840 RepID=UPI000592E017|nr:hypothetical protein [Paenibacillus curdlanolyticus]
MVEKRASAATAAAAQAAVSRIRESRLSAIRCRGSNKAEGQACRKKGPAMRPDAASRTNASGCGIPLRRSGWYPPEHSGS